MVDAKKLSELEALYRNNATTTWPESPTLANRTRTAGTAGSAGAAAAPQVGVYPQPGGRTYYTAESDYFRNLTPQQQTALVGSAVQPEGFGPNNYQPMVVPPPLPMPAAPVQAPVKQQAAPIVEEDNTPMLWQPGLDPAKAGLDLAKYYKGVR